MSISGDIVVMRNGRSTSQVSIYNYPEHLNPFYEDDQHKRLRFWHIKKKPENERWRSVSISNLKDLWPLKSFRLSKKKSSTLGINKTSESPPQLRHEFVDYSFGPPSCRASMQTVYTTKRPALGFERNNEYRSTIQVMGNNQRGFDTMPLPKRFSYGRSVTPQMSRSYQMETPVLTRRSSRTSTTSTNPFEDSEDEYEELSQQQQFVRAKTQTQSLTPAQRKMKRRAPKPNALNNKSSTEEQAKSSQNVELRIEEDGENLSIANLAHEIQSFVDTKLDDETVAAESTANKQHVDTKLVDEARAPDETLAIKENTDYKLVEKPGPAERKPNKQEVVKKIVETKPIKENGILSNSVETIQVVELIEERAAKPTPKEQVVRVEQVDHVEIINEPHAAVRVNAQALNSSPETIVRVNNHVEPTSESSQVKITQQVNPVQIKEEVVELREKEKSVQERVTNKTPFVLVTPPRTNSTSERNSFEVFGPSGCPTKPRRSSLKKKTVEFIQNEIRQEEENSRENTENAVAVNQVSKEVETKKEIVVEPKTQVVEEKPTNLGTISPQPTLQIVESVDEVRSAEGSKGAVPRPRVWKDSSLAPLQENVPPEKRKSAKEIIESINRQQRLLREAAERNLAMNTTGSRLHGVINYNHYTQSATTTNNMSRQENGFDHAREGSTERDPQKLDNGSPVFAKCRVYKEVYTQRESSPTASNLDWNPVPKPKRNKDIQLDQ